MSLRGEPNNSPVPTEPIELATIAVVIPCFRASQTLAAVVAEIGKEVSRIYCVDDASGDSTGEVIGAIAERDTRVRQISRTRNGGVGAAVVDGIQAAIADGATVIVKIDSDGQMNPAYIANFAEPILSGEADYVKGNRFYSIEQVARMPTVRVAGNAGLSFFSKVSTGYWDLFDPTNGYIAIHSRVAKLLPLEKLHPRYFFESDLLFRLSTLRARVIELPMEAVYNGAKSHLSEWRCLFTFPFLHGRNFLKRLFYNYLLRDFSAATISILAGGVLFVFGVVFGGISWADSIRTGHPATAGTVMLSALPLMIGIQLLLNFLSMDIALIPKTPIHMRLGAMRVLASDCALKKVE